METNYMTRKTWDTLNQKLQENLDAIKKYTVNLTALAKIFQLIYQRNNYGNTK